MSTTDTLALRAWPGLLAVVCGWFAWINPPPGFFSGFADTGHPVARVVFGLAAITNLAAVFSHRARVWALAAVTAAFWGRAVALIQFGAGPGFSTGRDLVAVFNWLALFSAAVLIHLLTIPRVGSRGFR